MTKVLPSSILFCFITAAVCHASSAEVLLRDGFSDPSLPRWKVASGKWTASGGVLSETTGIGAIAVGDERWEDYELNIRCRLDEPTGDKDHFLCVKVRGVLFLVRQGAFTYQLIEQQDGKATTTDSGGVIGMTHELGRWYSLLLLVQPKEIAVYRDGEYVCSSKRFLTTPGPVSLSTYGAKASFRDIAVYALNTGEKQHGGLLEVRHALVQAARTGVESSAAKTPSPNLISNGDLELATNQDLPDAWGYYALKPVGDDWLYDDHVAYSGKRSIRLRQPLSAASLCSAQIVKDTPYTWSAYMKAERDGTPVMMDAYVGWPSGGKTIKQDVKVGREWQRYTFTFKPFARSICFTFTPRGEGYVWIDAIQFEPGETPTAFRPSDDDAKFLPSEVAPDLVKLPRWDVPITKQPPNIDGDLSDPCWARATALPMVNYDTGKPAAQKTTAFLLRDEWSLYLGFRCAESQPAKLRDQENQRDAAVWIDDSIEIFLDAELSQERYYQLAVNARGTQYDASSDGYFATDAQWDGVWQTKTKVGDAEWTMEVVLPLGNFNLGPLTSEWWGINLCRNDQQHGEYLCTFPTLTAFHNAKRYGQARVFDTPARQAHSWSVRELSLLPFGVPPLGGSLNLEAHNDGKPLKAVRLKARVIPRNSAPQDQELTASVPTGPSQAPFGTVTLQEPEARVVVEAWTPEGQLLNRVSKVVAAPEPLTAFWRLSFYSNEGDAEIVYRSHVSAAKGSLRVRLTPEASPDKVVFTAEKAAQNSGVIRIPLAKLQYGRYHAALTLEAGDSTVATTSTPLVYLPAKQNEVKVDRQRRCLIANGRPFLVFCYSMSNFAPLGEEVIKYHRDAGLDSLFIWGFRPGRSEKPDLELAAKYGLRVIPYVGGPLDDKGLAAMVDVMNADKDHPVLLCWIVLDEPMKDPQLVAKRIAVARETDPSRPIWVNQVPPGITGRFAGLTEDILGTDFYWNPPSHGRTCASQGYFMRRMMEIGAREGKPVFIWLQNYGAPDKLREPTPQEQEGQTYLCVIEGARGIIYFVNMSSSPRNRERIASLYQELKALSPALFSVEDVPDISTDRKAVRHILRKVDGEWYLITVNSGPDPVTARFDLSPLVRLPRTAEVMFEGRRVRLADGVLKDAYVPHQRHVYRLRSGQ